MSLTAQDIICMSLLDLKFSKRRENTCRGKFFLLPRTCSEYLWVFTWQCNSAQDLESWSLKKTDRRDLGADPSTMCECGTFTLFFFANFWMPENCGHCIYWPYNCIKVEAIITHAFLFEEEKWNSKSQIPFLLCCVADV